MPRAIHSRESQGQLWPKSFRLCTYTAPKSKSHSFCRYETPSYLFILHALQLPQFQHAVSSLHLTTAVCADAGIGSGDDRYPSPKAKRVGLPLQPQDRLSGPFPAYPFVCPTKRLRSHLPRLPSHFLSTVWKLRVVPEIPTCAFSCVWTLRQGVPPRKADEWTLPPSASFFCTQSQRPASHSPPATSHCFSGTLAPARRNVYRDAFPASNDSG